MSTTLGSRCKKILQMYSFKDMAFETNKTQNFLLVLSPYLFRSYYNLNCIKDLSVIFSTPPGERKCIKKHLECPNKSRNQWHLLKCRSSYFLVVKIRLRISFLKNQEFKSISFVHSRSFPGHFCTIIEINC